MTILPTLQLLLCTSTQWVSLCNSVYSHRKFFRYYYEEWTKLFFLLQFSLFYSLNINVLLKDSPNTPKNKNKKIKKIRKNENKKGTTFIPLTCKTKDFLSRVVFINVGLRISFCVYVAVCMHILCRIWVALIPTTLTGKCIGCLQSIVRTILAKKEYCRLFKWCCLHKMVTQYYLNCHWVHSIYIVNIWHTDTYTDRQTDNHTVSILKKK